MSFTVENNKFKKIAFVGTCCTGKTTLVEEYRQRFQNQPHARIIGEVARDFFTHNPNIVDRFSIDIQGQIQSLVLKNEEEAHESGATIILCDRSVVDGAVYVRSQGNIQGSRELLKRVLHWMPTYHRLFLLNPSDVPYQQDDIRQETEEVRQGLHEAFLDFFEEANISYELLKGDLKARIARVDEVLNEI